MKRITAVIFSLLILLILIPAPSLAASEVFVATNNLMLPLTDAMPIKSGGVWYIDYKSFSSGDLKVHSAYNEQKKTLVIYTWDTTLIFNMENATAYTTDEMIAHKQWCFANNGTLYVPVDFTAKMLGFESSFIDDIPLIRIKSDTNVPDNVYYYIAQSNKKNFLDAYYASKNKDNEPATGTTPGTGEKPLTPPATVEEKPKTPEIRKIAYITFSIDSGSNNDAILDILSQYNINATFFIQGKTLFENDDSIRRMIATGHAVGISGYNGDADFRAEPSAMLEEMAKANDLLFKIARVKTRLVRVPSGSKSALDKDDCDALIDAGYRFWDWNTDPKGTHENPSSATIYRNAVKALKARNTPAVIILRDDQSSVSALSRILKYIKDSNYIARVISVLDSPVNQLNDNR